MERINIDAFKYAISIIDDGFVFEKFAQAFLSAYLGASFIPVGGTKDKGIDGFMHVFHQVNRVKTIFQMSTELDWEGKIKGTIAKLNDNGIPFDRLIYVTNRKVSNKDVICDKKWEEGINLTIYDEPWFISNCSASQSVINAYQTFLAQNMYEYSKPGHYCTIANLDSDSRLYVFLNQQFSNRATGIKTDELVIDSLILFSLEGTDPDKEKLMTQEEILEAIKKYISFSPELIKTQLSERLKVLTTKPRKVKFHSAKHGYCLPYETRCEIQERNLSDQYRYDQFYKQSCEIINRFNKEKDVITKDVFSLIEICLRTIFKKQGLEFSNYVLTGDSSELVEQNLDDVIGQAVDESPVIFKNKQLIKDALHLGIREIIYHGTKEQHDFLRSLSNTYMMMFLMKWEPKITTYFESLSSKLILFVDTSILIPAFSERLLEERNRRHWNLLIGAKQAGIKMYIYESHLDELVTHLQMIRNKYYSLYYPMEDAYNDETTILYIDEILIRAYYYAKLHHDVNTFDDFLDNFVSPDLKPTVKRELIQYLNEVFGIELITKKQWDVKIDDGEVEQLVDFLSYKKNAIKARNDAEMILSLYGLREKNKEEVNTGIMGYRTWWLSKDTSTYRAVTQCFKDKYPVSCYIRPDFIYNYITLSPTTEEVSNMYDNIFPTMLGVNLSYHLPDHVTHAVQQKIKEFHGKEPIRVKQILNNLSDRLKTTAMNEHSVVLFLDEQLNELPHSDKDLSNAK